MSKNGRMSTSGRRSLLAGAGLALVSAVSLLASSPASAASVTAVTQVQAASAPSAPTNLRAVNDANGVLTAIAWDAPASSEHVSYRVNAGTDNLWSTSKTSVTMYELVYDACLNQGSTRTVTVQAVSGTPPQLSGSSNPLTITIPKVSPRRP
jgi:hypothetical protein